MTTAARSHHHGNYSAELPYAEESHTKLITDSEVDFPYFANDDSPDVEVNVPGDVTTIENEEFSMISVESLSSHHSYNSNSPANVSHGALRHGPGPKADTTMSYMPSSPPVLRNPVITPHIMQTPQQPPAHLPLTPKYATVTTPLRESAVRSGKVLQDIVRSPDHGSICTRESSGQKLSAGFSRDSVRDPRASQAHAMRMSLGPDLPLSNSLVSSTFHQSNSLGIHYSNISRPTVDHRLPTPDEQDHEKSASSVSSGPPVYPKIATELLHPSSVVSRHSVDMMRWAPTGQAEQGTPMPKVKQAAVSDPQPPAQRSPSVISVSSDPSDDFEEEEEELELEDEAGPPQIFHQNQGFSGHSGRTLGRSNEVPSDIWQEQAFDDVPQHTSNWEMHQDTPGATEQAVFSSQDKFSNMQRPNATQHRTASTSNSSSRSGGVATPLSTCSDEDYSEDGAEDAAADLRSKQSDDHEHRKVRHPDPLLEAVSADADDTGLFWQSNLPNVFRRQQGQKDREYSVMSELKPIDSSMLSNSGIEARTSMFLEEKQARKQSGRRPERASFGLKESAPTLSSPLRKSLLKSSKLESILGSGADESSSYSVDCTRQDFDDVDQPSAYEQEEEGIEATFETLDNPDEETEETSDESTAADVRQLRDEMAAQLCCDSGIQDPDASLEIDSGRSESSWLESTNLQASKSYLEDLNLASPMKVAVKFNDSSVLAQSTSEHLVQVQRDVTINTLVLSPQKKKYSSLFQDDAPLGARDVSGSEVDNSRGDNRTPPNIAETPSRSKSGLMSQMAGSFWSAVKSTVPATQKASVTRKPEAPAADLPKTSTQRLQPVVRVSTSNPDAATISDLTIRLRRKYGLLSPSHPFTLAHARTLHRLYLSTVQHPDRTLIPLSTSVPAGAVHLLSLPSRPSKTHVHVVACFMSLLVPDPEHERLEAQGGWGDARAVKDRGWDSRGRHGGWFAFTGEGKDDKAARAMRGEIEMGWALDVLTQIVIKETASAKR